MFNQLLTSHSIKTSIRIIAVVIMLLVVVSALSWSNDYYYLKETNGMMITAIQA